MNKEIINRIISSVILIPLVLFFTIKGSWFFNFLVLVCLLITSYEWHIMTKKKKYYYLGFIFLILSFLSALFLRNNFIHDFILVILICIFTDIGGFVFGKIFKGPKLTKISPNKTYSGAIGSYFLSIVSVLLYVNYYGNYWCGSACPSENKLLIITLLISTISQIGDLTISFFKRKSKIKNTGKIIPGHGGLLDRIDGMLFAIPFTFLLLKYL